MIGILGAVYIDEAKISVDCELEPRSDVDYIYFCKEENTRYYFWGREKLSRRSRLCCNAFD